MPGKKLGTSTKSESVDQDISVLLAARNSLLWIVSQEETRVEKTLIDIAQLRRMAFRWWDCATGISEFGSDGKVRVVQAPPQSYPGQPDQGADPDLALKFIRENKNRAVYVLRDFHKWIANPITLRRLRNVATEIQSCPNSEARAIIILSPVSEIPPELNNATVISYPLPDRTEIGNLLDDSLVAFDRAKLAEPLSVEQREQAIDAAVGLRASEAENCFARSLVSVKRIDPSLIAGEKKRVIEREKVLQWIDPDPRGLNAVGGLDQLKAWLNARKATFTLQAREYGLPPVKGCLLVGVPGGGKSLTAKCIASAWGLPLLRLDLGALKSKFVGDSEANIRKALSVADAISPAVVWLDEIEKALKGASGEQGDGGVSSDALGVFLSWMQDRVGQTFVIATANDVRALPPELLRKERFDEVFFVGLPTRSERAQILLTALRKYKRKEDEIELDRLAEKTAGWTGAEIASLVPSAMFLAFEDNQREITTLDLLQVSESVVPLSKTSKDKIDNLLEWAKTNARPASYPETTNENQIGRDLDLS